MTYTINQILEQLQSFHLKVISGLRTAPKLKRSTQSSELPTCILIPQNGTHSRESSHSASSLWAIQAQVYVLPEGMGESEEIEEQVYALLDGFINAYNTHSELAPSIWLQHPYTTSGIILLEFVDTFYGFVIDFNVYVGNRTNNYNGGLS